MSGGCDDRYVTGVKNFSGEPTPETYGHKNKDGGYIFDFEKAVTTIVERGDFLFQDRTDMAYCHVNGQVIRIFALGGAAAYGIGASSIENRWHAVLERGLSKSTGQDLRIIPAALPGYVITQERIILDLTGLPFEPDEVIIFDGFNDAALPAIFGSRLGDP